MLQLKKFPDIPVSTREEARESRQYQEEPRYRPLAREEGSFPCVFGKESPAFPSHLKRRRSHRKGQEGVGSTVPRDNVTLRWERCEHVYEHQTLQSLCGSLDPSLQLAPGLPAAKVTGAPGSQSKAWRTRRHLGALCTAGRVGGPVPTPILGPRWGWSPQGQLTPCGPPSLPASFPCRGLCLALFLGLPRPCVQGGPTHSF